jgi:hypothetical protein
MSSSPAGTTSTGAAWPRQAAPGCRSGDCRSPVHLPAGRATLIRDARLADPAVTAQRVPDILRQYYKHAPHAAAVLDLLPQLQATLASSERLADITEHTTAEMLRLVGWPGVVYRSSALPARSGRSERLVDLTSYRCHHLPVRHPAAADTWTRALHHQGISHRDVQAASARG